MIFAPLPLPGAFTIEIEARSDERGFFARAFCKREMAAAGLETVVAQANLSGNVTRGTLRGLHYQVPPNAEVKMVRCISGAVYDVIVDVRRDSPTYLRWHGVELSAVNHTMLYVPKGFAHGYQSLTAGSEVLYLVTEFYSPAAERGLRWNDPLIGIRWPIPDPILSPKDAAHPDFVP
jgi:dTDP-4-dehydrorhamnose 3,5-epimerase